MPERALTIPFLAETAIHKTYENGYSIVFIPKKGEVFNISTWVKTGSIHENAQNNGVSHFLEHLMFKGTERFGPGEFDKAMESMGAIINAATWKDFTFYYVTGPKGSDNQNFLKAADMHADMVIASTLPDGEIGETHDPHDKHSSANKRERGVVIEEIGMRNDQPWTKIYNALNHMMYPEAHPYQRDVIGTREIIASIPRQAILDYYNTWYSPRAMTTIVVGDFNWEWLEPKLLGFFNFEGVKRAHAENPQFVDALPETLDPMRLDGQRYHEQTGDVQTTFFIMGFHGPRAENLKQTIALDIACTVLGSGRSARLTQALIEKPTEPIFNAISAGQSTFKLGNVIFVQGNFNADDSDPPIQQVRDEITAMLTSRPITAEEFHRAVIKKKVEFAETSETASSLADAIGESITVTGSIEGYTAYLETLSQLTLADVQAAANHYLALQHAYTAVMMPNAEGDAAA